MSENRIKERLSKCLDNMNHILDQLINQKQNMHNHYNSTYKDYVSYYENNEEIKYSSEIFEQLFDRCCIYIRKQVLFVERVLLLQFIEQNKFSIYMENLLEGLLSDIECDFPYDLDMNRGEKWTDDRGFVSEI